MKLLNKSSFYYLLISIPVFLFAGYVSYMLVKSEVDDSVNETLIHESLQAQHLIESEDIQSRRYISLDSLSFIEPSSRKTENTFSDTLVWDEMEAEQAYYRIYTSGLNYKNSFYKIRLVKPLMEEEELTESILSIFALVMTVLVLVVVIANRWLSKRIWQPFYNTLHELDQYELTKHTHQHFEVSNIDEFNQLNIALKKLMDKIYGDYLRQKEFTENASHELQTPIAIIKSHLDLLMQSKNMKAEEMGHLASIENTLVRITQLNKALILLSKIENQQFEDTSYIQLSKIIHQELERYAFSIEKKNLTVKTNIDTDFSIIMNPMLADLLISNLLQNAIRHNVEQGCIEILLTDYSFIIRNTGPSLTIKPKEMFDRFTKNDASKESIGLGLSIVKSIITHYGFEIIYEHQSGLHEFTVLLTRK